MAERTGIEWTRSDDGTPGATWNPVTGCQAVSRGCDHCYAKTFAERFRGTPGHHFERGFDVTLRPDRLDLPLRWRTPRRVFVNSMSDLFMDAGEVPDGFLARMFAVMAATPRHTYLVLTKRHARMRSLLNATLGGGGFADQVEEAMAEFTHATLDAWPLPNVWLGVSVEDQHWADIRIPALLETRAAVRWVSAEPLLGPLDLAPWLPSGPGRMCGPRPPTDRDMDMVREFSRWLRERAGTPTLDWVVAGGESGPGARPMHPAWPRALRDQATRSGTPYFHKQWGQYTPVGPVYDAHGGELYDEADLLLAAASGCAVDPDGSQPMRWDRRGHTVTTRPAAGAWWMARTGKQAAGRVLDGRTWDQYPRPGLLQADAEAGEQA